MEALKALDKRGRLALPEGWRERCARRGLVLARMKGPRAVVAEQRPM